MQLDTVIFKVDAYDILPFIAEVKKEAPNSIIVVLNYGGELIIAHKPAAVRLKEKYLFYKPDSISSIRIVKWLIYYLQNIRILCRIYASHKSDRLIFEGADILGIFAFGLRLFRRTRKLILISSDWVTLRTGRRSITEVINILKLYSTDFFISRFFNRILVTTKGVLEGREKLYGKKHTQNCILVENYWSRLLVEKVSTNFRATRRKIAYLGTIRNNFGIEEMLENLGAWNRKYGITLKIIGPENHLSAQYKSLITGRGLQNCVEWTGFVATEKLPEIMADCFCGVNLQMLPDNPSKLAIAGRVVNFIQFLVPSIVTEYSGAIVPHIKQHHLGIVVDPTADAIHRAIVKTFLENRTYVKSCKKFIAGMKNQVGFHELFG